MRRTTFALLATVAAVCTCLFAATAALAQAPAATISVTGNQTTWSPSAVTVSTGETVRWSFAGSALPHNVHSSSSNWNVNSPIGTAQAPVDFTFTTAGVYSFLCDVHGSGMSGTVTVEEPGADPLESVLVFSKTAGFRHDSIPAGHRGDPAARHAERLHGHGDRGQRRVHRREPGAVRRGRLALDHR